MAIFHSHIFDNASGSVGNVTMCKYKGKSIAKGKIFFKKKKQSPAQVIQQTRSNKPVSRFFPTCPTISTRLYKPDSPVNLGPPPEPDSSG